jgi:hypothetical protein
MYTAWFIGPDHFLSVISQRKAYFLLFKFLTQRSLNNRQSIINATLWLLAMIIHHD